MLHLRSLGLRITCIALSLLFSSAIARATTCDSQGVWTQITATPAAPDSVGDHTAIYDPGHQRMWIYGGDVRTEDGTDRLYYLQLDSLTWHVADVPTTGDGPPTGREGHTAVYDSRHHSMIIFGGYKEDVVPFFRNDIWSLQLDSLTWHQVVQDNCYNGNIMRCRWYALAVYDSTSDRMAVYGGDYYDLYKNDTWIYTGPDGASGHQNTWVSYDATGMESTNPAGGLNAANNLVVFGGLADGGAQDSTRILNLGGTPSWTGGAHGPSARYDAAYAVDRRRQRLLIIGGYSTSGDLSDVWAYDLVNGGWTQLSPSGSFPGRSEATAIYDSKNDRVVVYGGKAGGPNGARLNDAWRLSFDPNTKPSTVSNLARYSSDLSSIGLKWTAPGDDGVTGTACAYDLRYSTTSINSSNFGSANQVAGLPTPRTSGSADSMLVTGLASGTTYYFALKTRSHEGNWSSISNVVQDHTLFGNSYRPATTPAQLSFGIAKANPAAAVATWQLAIPAGLANAPYEIALYNPAGKLVKTITSAGTSAGNHDIQWDLTDNGGSRVSPGMYFARLRMGGQVLRSAAVVLQ